jgi:hypothetical protein
METEELLREMSHKQREILLANAQRGELPD